jgi:hypothetical protein
MELCRIGKCARCCVIKTEEGYTPCKYLTDKKMCSVYDTRLNRDLGYGHRCSLREDAHVNYPDCAYNHEDWAMHPAYK